MSGLILPDGTPASRLLYTSDQFRNRLSEAASPYLKQHAGNPVAWQEYGEAAFEEARKRDVPLLISIGYAACHWCHVMEHETFSRTDVAEWMNRDFVCVKVDREELPDVDHVYMTAVQMLSGSGGWPLNVFVTPEGQPFFGGTYFPPERRHGMPSWREVCSAISEAWRTQQREVVATGKQLWALLQQDAERVPANELEGQQLEKSAKEAALLSVDRKHGGFGVAPKFPQPHWIHYLMELASLNQDAELDDIVQLTLDNMMHGGIHDHVGGGFARYSTDHEWTVPHFEKMLYDNALLANLYFDAAIRYQNSSYQLCAKRTVDWAIDALWRNDESGFASSLDADSDGEEGKFYVWTMPQIRAVLGDQTGGRFSELNGITERGNFESHQNVITANHNKDYSRWFDTWKTELEKLRQHRNTLRTIPSRDDKILTDWNGWMLSALAKAATQLNDKKYIEYAVQIAEYYANEWKTTNGLPHSRLNRKSAKRQYSLDYAALGCGLIDLYEATGDDRWMQFAFELGDEIHKLFAQPEGYVTSCATAIADLHTTDWFDTATPSSNSQVALFWVRLFAISGAEQYQNWANQLLRCMNEHAKRSPNGFGQALRAVMRTIRPSEQIVLSRFDANLLSRIRTRYSPIREYAFGATVPLPLLSQLLNGKTDLNGQIGIYSCKENHCEAPVTEPANLA